MSTWLVWFSYYSERADVGLVEAESAEAACAMFWAEQGSDHTSEPWSGVHATPAHAGIAIQIDTEH